jgi:hypothetical protein
MNNEAPEDTPPPPPPPEAPAIPWWESEWYKEWVRISKRPYHGNPSVGNAPAAIPINPYTGEVSILQMVRNGQTTFPAGMGEDIRPIRPGDVFTAGEFINAVCKLPAPSSTKVV